jgi:hypothetical protein
MDSIAPNPARTLGLKVHVDRTICPTATERAATILGEAAWRQHQACSPDRRLNTPLLQRAWISGWVRLENEARRRRHETLLSFPDISHTPAAAELDAARKAGRRVSFALRVEVYDLTHPRGPRLVQIHHPVAALGSADRAHRHAQRLIAAFRLSGQVPALTMTERRRPACAA